MDVSSRFFGVVLPLAFTQIIAWGTIYFSFPLFIEPIHRDLGWSHSAISGGISVAFLVAAGMQLVVGRLVGWLGPHLTMCCGTLLAAGSMALLGINHSLYGYYLAWILLGIAIALCFFETAFAALLDWFPTRFERSVSVLILVSGFSATLFLPLTYWLITHLGWRETFLCFCLFHLFATLVSFFLANARRGGIPEPKQAPPAFFVPGLLHKGDFREPRFWCLAASFALNTGVITTLVIHLFGILVARDFPVSLALGVIALLGPVQAIGRFLQMGMEGRLSFASITLVAFAIFFAGVLALQAATSPGCLIWIAIVLIGIGSGMMATLRGIAPAILFDSQIYAQVAGAIAAPSSLIRAMVPFGAAYVASTHLKYSGVMWMISAFAALGLLLVACALAAYRSE